MESFILSLLSVETVGIITKLFTAIVLGMLIGIERVMAHKTAGPRTHALVAMGSALFVMISEVVSERYSSLGIVDPLRMASQIIVGVGFLGAGMIIFKDSHLQGLTTASGLWVAAAIGTAVGFGLYEMAIITTALTLFIFVVLWFAEDRIVKKIAYKNEVPPTISNQ